MDHSIRASRPSRHGIDPDMVAEAVRAKEMAIRLYQQLVERGMPLFEEPGEQPDTPSPIEPAGSEAPSRPAMPIREPELVGV